jgi:hemolysin activation/secretion protein
MVHLRGRLKATAGLACLLCCFGAAAQQPAAPQPGRDRPLPEAAPPADLDFTIQAPRRSPVPRAVEELTFDVKDVHVVGATRYSQEALRPLIQPVIGQTVHLADLIAIAEAIEARYHQDGYVLTRAFVPTQSVNDGVFQITVVEGYVAAVAVQGGDEEARARVEKVLAPVTAERPLKIGTLETALLTINKLPGINASGLLRPSATEAGASELVVTVKELPTTGGLAADNMGAANTGRWTIAADATTASPLGDGGQISLNASTDPTNPHTRYSAGGIYTAPLPLLDGMTYTLSGLGSHGEPGGTVSNLGLVTNSSVFGARVALPLIESRAEELSVNAGLTVQSSDVQAQGIRTNHDEWRVFDVALTYQNNVWEDGATNATLDVAQGIPSLGASQPPDGGNALGQATGSTDFTKLVAQIRRLQPVAGPLSVSLLVSGQYVNVRPVLGEEVSYGGQLIGRGYDPGSITADSGIGGAFEARYDLNPSWFYADAVQAFLFADGAKVHNHDSQRALSDDTLASVGGGLRVTIPGNVVLGLMYGKALIGVTGNDEGRRTSRVMFNTAVRF